MKNTNIRSIAIACLFLFISSFIQAQNEPPITWMGGDDVWNQGPNGVPLSAGKYGQMGVPDAANFPGGRNYSASWTDLSGNLWLFGGLGYDRDGVNGNLNDLWRYNPSTKQWTWMNGSDQRNQQGRYGPKGTPLPSNIPGARYNSVSWTDNRGNLWLYGGQGYDKDGNQLPYLNDLWKYDVLINAWTFVNGNEINIQMPNHGTKGIASGFNQPGGRSQSMGWADASGNLWLFGGATMLGDMNDMWRFNTTSNQWTWIAGSNSGRQAGVYGTKDVASASNTPGSRRSAVSWTDANGNFWLFGGQGYDKGGAIGNLNDLWRFSTSTNQWTWVGGSDQRNQLGVYGTKGVAAGTNVPGARIFAHGWADKKGNLWLFGGSGFAKASSAGLTDLWKYNIATNLWTWVNGGDTGNELVNFGTKGVPSASTAVGVRIGTSEWIDAQGNLWLFGGSTTNHLWKYHVDIDQWSWESGLTSITKGGVYGSKGVASNSNLPGARNSSITWKDKGGNLWMFGGSGYDKNGASNRLNDVWKYDIVKNQWIWVGGSDVVTQEASYGTKGVSSPTNMPGGRSSSMSWMDTNGNLWMFGGLGFDKNGTSSYLNDLWKYDMLSQQWTWIVGSDTAAESGRYGTKGVADALNVPGARSQAVTWTDSNGNLWLFGGIGYDKSRTFARLNDLWKYDIVKNQWTWMGGSDVVNQVGIYGTKGTASATTIPGARSSSVGWTDAKGNFWLFGGTGYDKSTLSSNLNDLWKFNVTSGQWTWMSGSDAGNQEGTSQIPGARQNSIGWYDSKDNLWLFGGSSMRGSMSDLWKFNTVDTGWVLVKGSFDQSNQRGEYGTKGKGNNFNLPGARNSSRGWVDNNGDLWLFGGTGYDKNGASGFLNDLWRISMCLNIAKPKFNTDKSIVCSSEQNPFQLSVINSKKGDNLEWTGKDLKFYDLNTWQDFVDYATNKLDSTFIGSKYNNLLSDPTKKVLMDAAYIYVVLQDYSSGCEVASDPVIIVKAAGPSKPNVKDLAFCLGATATQLTADVSSGHFLNWYGTSATGGTATTTAPIPTTNKADTLTYYVSQTSTLTYCESPRAELKVAVKPQPATPVLTRNGDVLNSNVSKITWYRNDVKLADTAQKLKLDLNGVFSAMLSQNGCDGPLSTKVKYVNAPNLESIKAGNKIDTLSWSIKDTSTIRFIKIFRDTVVNPKKLLDSVDAKKTSYIDTNKLSLNVKYYYKIAALDIDKFESDSSNILSVTPRNLSPIPVRLTSKDYSEAGEYNFIKTSFSAAGSKDIDGSIIKLEWYINDTLKNSKDTSYEYKFPQGTTAVKLIVYDNDGAKDSSVFKVKVSALSKQFSGGIFGGISALNRDNIYVTDTTNRSEYGSNVFKLNRLGKTQLQLSVGAKIFNTPSITVDSSVLITNGINFNGFNKSGVPLWPTFPLGGITKVTPTIDSVHSKIYLGVSNRNFIAVDYKTGRPVWSYFSDAPINASAVITGNRRLVFTSESGTLYGFDIVKDTIQTTPKWIYNVGEVVSKSAAVDLSSNLYLGTNKGNLIKLRLNTDATVTKLWSTSLTDSIDCSPVIDANGFVYVGNNGGNMYKIDPNTGNILWTYKSGAAIKSTPAITEFGTINFANIKGEIYSLDTLRNLRWKHEAGSPISANLLYIENMVYAGTENGNLIGIFDNPKTSTIAGVVNVNIFTPFETITRQVILPEGSFQKGAVAEFNNLPTSTPIWGTFQGNYRRTGSQVVECPTKPTISSQINSFSFCQGDSIKLNAPSTNDKFSWNSKSGAVKNVFSNSLTLNKTEDVYLIQTNIYGCSITSDTVSLKVKSLPLAPAITRDSAANLVSSVGSGLTWYKDNVKISDTTQRIKPTSNGNYSLKLTADGCTSLMSASYYYLTTAVTNLSNDEYVHLFPNPTTGVINIQYKLNSLKDVLLTVIDMTGKAVVTNKKVISGERMYLNSLAKGSYIIQFKDATGKLITTQKLIKY